MGSNEQYFHASHEAFHYKITHISPPIPSHSFKTQESHTTHWPYQSTTHQNNPKLYPLTTKSSTSIAKMKVSQQLNIGLRNDYNKLIEQEEKGKDALPGIVW